MKEIGRKVLKIAGIVLIAAGLCVVGYYTYNIISMDTAADESVLEAEELLAAQEFVEEMDGAYTGEPLDSLAPDATYEPSGEEGDAVADIEAALNSTSGAEEVNSGTPGPQGTAKPKKKSSVSGLLVFESLGGRKVAVLEGVTNSTLARGAAHHPRTSKPGAEGNCVIFGHRNTVFRGFGKLKAGAVIRLEVPGQVYKYTVISTAVVEPDDPRIFKAYGDKIMTLVTCYPFSYVGSAPQRYIVVAKLQ